MGESMKGKILNLKENKKAIVLLILILFMVCIGISYAYWYLTHTQSGSNQVVTDCFDIEFVEETDAITLSKAYPMTDQEGSSLTPYTFKISNKCNAYVSYQINLEILNTTTLDSQYVKGMLDTNAKVLTENEVVKTTLENATTSYKLATEYLDKNEEKTHTFRLWIDENVGMDDPVSNKTFEGKITITASYITDMPTDYDLCVEKYGEDSINCSIIAQLDDTGKCPTVNEVGTVQVTNTESTNSYLCSAPDDYGTSYYYRGTVENNWVKFAGYYWRILRINGDDSIRMIYAGDASVIDALPNKEEVLKNGYDDSSTLYTQIGKSSFNAFRGDNAYVGYMYGTAGSSTYEETHANINNSTIKETVDEWYENHIKNTEYEQYISDTLFCNDRSFASDNTGTGVGTSETRYRTSSNVDRTLYCKNQNDRFTVNDEIVGNGNLTNPIGLLTAEEAYLAGGASISNSSYYLYTGNGYWTMSPRDFNGYSAYIYLVNLSGYASNSSLEEFSFGVRLVINLKPDSLNTGDGTASNPYQIG